MLKIFLAHCKSNWKVNIMTNGFSFFYVIIWMNIWNRQEGDAEFVASMSAMLILICLLPLVNLNVPKTLYICPYSFEDRKNYVKRGFSIRVIFFSAVYFLVSVTTVITRNGIGEVTWYSVLMQNILAVLFAWLNSISYLVPGLRQNNSQDTYSRLAEYVGWRDSIFKMIYDIMIIMGLAGISEPRPAINAGCIIQWILIILGLLMVRRFYGKHFNVLVSMAADYETSMRYQTPMKK